MSHTISGLEARLGLRLLTRTTRSVAPTEAGDRLLVTVGHRFEEIEAGVRSGEQVAKDMIAVRIGPDMRMAVVRPIVFREAITTKEAAGPDRPQRHQSAPAESWRAVRLGVRKRRPRTEGAR